MGLKERCALGALRSRRKSEGKQVSGLIKDRHQASGVGRHVKEFYLDS